VSEGASFVMSACEFMLLLLVCVVDATINGSVLDIKTPIRPKK
jgi:hypothetical protein